MVDEFNSHQTNGTWILTNLPEGRKAIGTRWVYKLKPGHLGTPALYKSRLVVKGYSKVEGIDFQENYAPIVKYTSCESYSFTRLFMTGKWHNSILKPLSSMG
jgi:hypothetical protein